MHILSLHYQIWIVLIVYFAGMLVLGWRSKSRAASHACFTASRFSLGLPYGSTAVPPYHIPGDRRMPLLAPPLSDRNCDSHLTRYTTLRGVADPARNPSP